MALTKARRAELESELLKTMDRLDALQVELKEQLAEHREQVKLHRKKLQDLRDILSGRAGEQVLMPGTETGEVKPAKASRAAPRTEAARETSAGLIQWKEPDEDGVVVGRHGRDTHKITPYSDGGFRYESPGGGGALPRGYKLEHAKAQCELRAEYREKDRARATLKRRSPKAISEREATPIPWTELEDAAHGGSIAQIGATEWRVLEVMPDRLVLESKSARERAWHKEGVYTAMAEVEAHVRASADMAALATQCGACGISADKPSPGCEECDHPAAAAPVPTMELAWREVDGTHRADGLDGEYQVLPGAGARLTWRASWVPKKGSSLQLASAVKLADAKAACQKHAAGKAVARG